MAGSLALIRRPNLPGVCPLFGGCGLCGLVPGFPCYALVGVQAAYGLVMASRMAVPSWANRWP
jgi:hypothetical protein